MTSDIIDLGNERAQEFLDDAIAAARRGPKGEPGIGICLFCGEPVEGERRWCDTDCRDDWEHEQHRKAAQKRVEDDDA